MNPVIICLYLLHCNCGEIDFAAFNQFLKKSTLNTVALAFLYI